MSMRRHFTVLIPLCFYTRCCLGFHAPPVPTTTATRRAHLPIKIASFFTTATTSKGLNNKFQLQMTKSEDDLTEETKNMHIMGYDTNDVISGINGDDASAAAVKTSETTPDNDSTASSSYSGFSLILLPILLFKFTIVLLVKFASDIVVYPMLYFYRMVKLGKRKISAVLSGKKDGSLNVRVNGDSSASSA